jgi:hypothetical protein
MWSLTSLRTKRISSVRKFRLLPPKDFFDSIDPLRTWTCHGGVTFKRRTDVQREPAHLRFDLSHRLSHRHFRSSRWHVRSNCYSACERQQQPQNHRTYQASDKNGTAERRAQNNFATPGLKVVAVMVRFFESSRSGPVCMLPIYFSVTADEIDSALWGQIKARPKVPARPAQNVANRPHPRNRRR